MAIQRYIALFGAMTILFSPQIGRTDSTPFPFPFPVTETPRSTLSLKVSEVELESMFSMIRLFADRHGFAVRIANTAPSGNNYLIELRREDTKILGVSSVDPGLFKFAIFDNYGYELPSEAVKQLIDELRSIGNGLSGDNSH